MILPIIFIVIGLTALIKKSISVSSKRKITGPKAQYFGIAFLAPALIGILSKVTENPMLGLIALIGYGIAVIIAIYLVITTKDQGSLPTA